MFCIHCGKQINEESKFCTACGKRQQPVGGKENTQATSIVTTQVTRYHELLTANNLKNVKHFEGLYTQIAVSENGYIFAYIAPAPAIKGFAWYSGAEAVSESFHLIHISQLNDFDIDVDGAEITKVSGGLGGAIVGGVLFGATGAVIGSAATSGKVSTNTTINRVDLVLYTKDFGNPQIRLCLFNGTFNDSQISIKDDKVPPALRNKYPFQVLVGLGNEGRQEIKEKYNDGQVNAVVIEALQSTLAQMLAAHQQSEHAATVAPQLSSADELAKFKELLDNGVITQEEFDAKKKQLLGL